MRIKWKSNGRQQLPPGDRVHGGYLSIRQKIEAIQALPCGEPALEKNAWGSHGADTDLTHYRLPLKIKPWNSRIKATYCTVIGRKAETLPIHKPEPESAPGIDMPVPGAVIDRPGVEIPVNT